MFGFLLVPFGKSFISPTSGIGGLLFAWRHCIVSHTVAPPRMRSKRTPSHCMPTIAFNVTCHRQTASQPARQAVLYAYLSNSGTVVVVAGNVCTTSCHSRGADCLLPRVLHIGACLIASIVLAFDKRVASHYADGHLFCTAAR